MRQDRKSWLWVGLVLTLWALGGRAAQGSPAEDRYILSRDQAVARFAAFKDIDKRSEANEARVRAELERQMRTILGPVRPQGFDAGKLNLNTLFRDFLGFGRLDGLLFETEGGDREMIVTTQTLLTRWLRTQEGWQDAATVQLDRAIRSEVFYARVARVNAAAVRFAELPLEVPLGQSAYAILAGRTQHRVPDGAGGVFVAAVKGERVFIANAALKPMFAIAACSAERADADEKLAGMLGGGQAKQGNALVERFNAMRDKIEADFLRCFAERAQNDPRFAEAVKLAQGLYDLMPRR